MRLKSTIIILSTLTSCTHTGTFSMAEKFESSKECIISVLDEEESIKVTATGDNAITEIPIWGAVKRTADRRYYYNYNVPADGLNGFIWITTYDRGSPAYFHKVESAGIFSRENKILNEKTRDKIDAAIGKKCGGLSELKYDVKYSEPLDPSPDGE